MKAYKGFNHDMTCRDFQYEEGKEYVTDEAELCKSGFHACLAPLDVLRYYAPCDDNGRRNKFHEVELDDVCEKRDGDDTNVCAKKIKIGAELNVFGLAKAQIEYVNEHVDKEKAQDAGNYGAANAGNYGAANAGDRGAANAGFRGAANAGDRGAANAGDRGAANAGFRGAANAGDCGAANAGYYGAANAGYYGAAISRGSASVGENGVALARGGDYCKAKGGLGSILILVREKDENYDIAEWKAVVVDGETIKPDTWYALKDGEAVEVEE